MLRAVSVMFAVFCLDKNIGLPAIDVGLSFLVSLICARLGLVVSKFGEFADEDAHARVTLLLPFVDDTVATGAPPRSDPLLRLRG